MDAVWAEQDTNPGAIEAALRSLLKERHAEDESYAPARVMNLVLIVDREWRGEIMNRLERVGRFHPSRTILCEVESSRKALDARVTMTTQGDPQPGVLTVAQERVELDCGPQHLKRLDTLVDPLVVTDLATAVWAPHGHWDAVRSMLNMAQIVLLDSLSEPDIETAVKRATELTSDVYVVDLSWLRSTPWRERISATFDPPLWRGELGKLATVTCRHRPDSAISGLLFFGWLSSRLGWEPGQITRQNGTITGRAKHRRGEVVLKLEPQPDQNTPGLAGITIETQGGVSIALERGRGGLGARRVARDGSESSWTIMGASRGESGILGEGIRQALLRDPTYRPALEAAGAMLG
ncbi:MAG TPA: glucose-6-phosphate dehydrogenase assembly protein OpcA [Thermoleophilaceae bacterium]|nr:glucose-6-phosphate dehydrogenase assembly protein OpcA [Thermoleophilaceae bacterium]